MKEATGELNTTVIVVISVGILMAFFFGVIWPALNSNFEKTTGCKAAVCNCQDRITRDGIEYCKCKSKNGEELTCVYKG